MISKSKLSILILIAVLLVTLVLCSSQAVFAKDVKYIIRAAHMDPPDPMGQVNAAFFAVFKDKIEELTGGEVEVDLFPSGQLGNDAQMYKEVKAGNIEMSGAGAGSLGSALYPPISIFELPFLFPDNKIAIDVLTLDNPFVKELVEGFKKETGLGILAVIPQSFRNLTNNVRPIKTPDDLKGLKIRTQQIPAHMKMVEATGAHSVPIAYTELYTSLQTGVVDGQENPLSNIVAMHFYEVQKYLTLSKHALNCSVPIYNVKWFESLPEDIQIKIMKAAEAARVSSSGLSHVSDVVNLEKVKEAGLEVCVPGPEELTEFKKIMQPDALELFKDQVKGGAELLSKLEKEIEKAEQRYKNLIY
jgi:C4-dicarboxylate-binding protein DctP